MICSTCGRLLNEHYHVDGKMKCVLPEGSDLSHLSEVEQLYHNYFWQWIKNWRNYES